MNQAAAPEFGVRSPSEPAKLFSGPRSETIRRILITTAWLGALVALVAWVYFGWPWALGFAGGTLVGMSNIFFLSLLSQMILTTGKRNKGAIAAVVALKILVVYGGLAALLLWHLPSALSVVAGFSVVLLVIVLKAAGRAMLDAGLFGRGATSDHTGDKNGES